VKLSSLVCLLLALVLLLPVSGLAGKGHKVKTTIQLEAGAPLALDVNSKELKRVSSRWECILKIFSGSSSHKELRRIEVEADGSWVAYKEEDDKEEDDKGEGDKGDDDDSAGDDDDSAGDDDDSAGDDDDSAGDDDDSADWKSKKVLTIAERVKKRGKKSLGKFTVEVARGQLVMPEAAAPKDGDKPASAAAMPTIVLPSELLPTRTFDIGSGGYFGISAGGVKIGSPSMTGVVRVKR